MPSLNQTTTQEQIPMSSKEEIIFQMAIEMTKRGNPLTSARACYDIMFKNVKAIYLDVVRGE